MYGPQKFSRGYIFLLRSTENAGGRGNPFSAIGANTFRTTNSRSRSAMRGAEFHGNTRREGQPSYPVYTGGTQEGPRRAPKGRPALSPARSLLSLVSVVAHHR